MDSQIITNLVTKVYNTAQASLNLPTLESLQNIDWSDIKSAITIIGFSLMLILFSVLILWLIRAIGLYKMAKDKNDKLAFIAFVPYGGNFVMGRIIRKNQTLWY